MKFIDRTLLKISKFPNWINTILLHCNVFRGAIYGPAYLKFKKEGKNIDSNDALINMVNFSIKNVKYYRDRYKGISINSIEDFNNNIGFINKDELMLHWNDFLVDNIDLSKCIQTTTGGTSGQPLMMLHPSNRYIIELAIMHSIWHRVGWKYHKRGVIRNHKLPTEQIYKINPLTKEYIFDAFRMSSDYAEQIYKVLKKNKIYFVQAYPSAAFQFCKLIHNLNLNLNFIKSFLCGSEAVTEEQRRFICDELGIKMLSWYGHSEKLVLGGFCEENNIIHIEPSYGYFELIDDQERNVSKSFGFGEIVGTTFYNRVMPLIRYRTGDYADSVGSYCSSCNRHLTLLKTVYGRYEKSQIYRADGTVTSTTALNLHDELYTHINGMQYIQEEMGKLIVLIIKNNIYSQDTENRLLSHYKYAMGKGSFVEIRYVDKLIYQFNGKFLPLISKIK